MKTTNLKLEHKLNKNVTVVFNVELVSAKDGEKVYSVAEFRSLLTAKGLSKGIADAIKKRTEKDFLAFTDENLNRIIEAYNKARGAEAPKAETKEAEPSKAKEEPKDEEDTVANVVVDFFSTVFNFTVESVKTVFNFFVDTANAGLKAGFSAVAAFFSLFAVDFGVAAVVDQAGSTLGYLSAISTSNLVLLGLGVVALLATAYYLGAFTSSEEVVSNS